MNLVELKKIDLIVDTDASHLGDDVLANALADRWNAFLVGLNADQGAYLRKVALEIYLKVVESYLTHPRALKVAELNRKYWKGLSVRGLAQLDFTSMLRGLAASDSLPIIVEASARGGSVVFPRIVGQTIGARGLDLDAFVLGGEGPLLSDVGKSRLFDHANIRVEMPRIVVPAESSSAAE